MLTRRIGMFLLVTSIIIAVSPSIWADDIKNAPGGDKISDLEELVTIEQKISKELEKKYVKSKGLMREGLDLTNEGKHDKAIEKFLQAKELVNIPLGNYYLGVSYYEIGDKKKATEFFNESLNFWLSGDWEPDQSYIGWTYCYKMLIDLDSEAYNSSLENCRLAISYSDRKDKGALKKMELHLIGKVEDSSK